MKRIHYGDKNKAIWEWKEQIHQLCLRHRGKNPAVAITYSFKQYKMCPFKELIPGLKAKVRPVNKIDLKGSNIWSGFFFLIVPSKGRVVWEKLRDKKQLESLVVGSGQVLQLESLRIIPAWGAR